MVDSYLNEGTKLYATKYTDPEAQIKLDDETDAKLKGYMLKAIASTFNLSITDTDITNFIKNENGEKQMQLLQVQLLQIQIQQQLLKLQKVKRQQLTQQTAQQLQLGLQHQI